MSIKVKINNDWIDTNIKAVRGYTSQSSSESSSEIRTKGTFLAAPSNKDGKADFRSIAFEDLPDSIKDTVLDNLSYGVSWKPNVADPVLTRVGNMNYHKTLPIQSEMKGCILNPKTKEVVYWLDESDWTYKKGGNPSKGETEDLARLDGYDGEVFVYVPEFWIKSWDTDTRREVRISPTKIDDSWEHQPAIFVSAYRNTVLNTVPENMGYLSTLEVNSPISVANSATYCRGGNNNATYDADGDVFKRDLGKPIMSSLIRSTFRNYARQTGKEIMSYKQYKNIIYWLYVIEYANFNCQDDFNPELTIEGFRQGGLGNGITNVSDATSYGGYYPVCPNGYTNNFGNGTGIKLIEPTYLEPVNNLYAIRWRGLENTFGDMWECVDGIIIDVNKDNHPNVNYVYTTDDPSKYGDTTDDLANMTLSGIETTKEGYIKEWDLGSTAEIIPRLVGGNSTQYKCDYHDYSNYSSSTPNVLLFGKNNYREGNKSGIGRSFSNFPTNYFPAGVSYWTVIVI